MLLSDAKRSGCQHSGALLSSKGFADVVGITPRAARLAFDKAFNGQHWHGHRLPVSRVTGTQGGSSGTSYVLHLDLCAPELRSLLADAKTSPELPVERGVKSPVDGWRIAEQQARWRIIEPVISAGKKGTEQRGEATRQLVDQPHDYPGGVQRFSESTLRAWITDFERDGLIGLLPKQRADRGKARTLITRDWDKQIDLPDAEKQRIADEIAKTARSMVANDGTSEREVRRICEGRLFHHCRAAGSQLPQHRLRRLSRLNAKWCDRQELKKFNLIYLKNKDHKAFQDRAVPRISRELHPVPMGLLIGDVHYVDILVEEGGEPIRVRLIHWMDASSLFVWTTPVFLSKGQGAGQENVAEALWRVSSCHHGGIPRQYYLDNGSEYAALTDAMMRLSCLADMDFGVTLAKPFSPTSKGDIEGHFNILEHIFKGLPGWIGGDRTNKKSQNKGQVIQPYRKGLDALEADIRDAVAIYNDRPQSGRLDGLSPLEMLEKKIADTGFEARVPSEEAFDLIFSKSDTKTIRQNAIEHDRRKWHSPVIDGLELGARVEVLIPLRKEHHRIFVRAGAKDEEQGWAYPLPTFQHGDREGARMQGRLEKGRVAAINKMKKQIDPTISTFDLQKQAVRRTEPNAPDPQRWTRAINKALIPPSFEEQEAAADEAARELAEEYEALCRPGKREASGCTR